MPTIQELQQQLFNDIDRLRNEIRGRRQDLALNGDISATWPIDNTTKTEAMQIVTEATNNAGLNASERTAVLQLIEQTINSVSSVAALEGALLDFQGDLNLSIMQRILANIDEPGARLDDATNQLELAIDRLNDLNRIFSVITVGVSLVASLLAASSGNFGALLSVIPQVINLASS